MTERRLPPAHRYATCPYEGRILDYYAGVFDAVYVALSPFTAFGTAEASPDVPVSWAQVREAAGLRNLAELDVALRTMIGGLNQPFARADLAEGLRETLSLRGWTAPDAGDHPDLLVPAVLEMFEALGHEVVWIGDEYGTRRKVHWIRDLKRDHRPALFNQHQPNIFSYDPSLLWTNHWDSPCSFLCGSRADLERVGVEHRLEGFFCTSETSVYWSIP